MRKIILRQRQSPGDILTFSNAVGDLKRSYPDWLIDVRSPCPEIWENNPHLTPLKEDEEGIEIFDIGYPDIHISGWNGLHFTDAFRNDIENKLGVKIKKTGIRPELYISDLEKSWYNQIHCEFKDDSPFWLINAGYKDDNELKFYHRWQEVADLFNERFQGKIKLVQIGHINHVHPKLKGVYDLVGKTDTRQLIRLCYWAHGTIGPLSFQFVMSAAFEQSAVCIAAGKEGVRWHIYPHIRYLYTNGALPCCRWDGCWLGGAKGQCKDLIDGVPHCFRLIEPYMIIDAIEMYYKGGRLKMPESEMKF